MKFEDMTRDELFCYVADALLRQGRRSIGKDGQCSYRGMDGLRCAIGHLIMDDQYNPSMEDDGILDLSNKYPGLSWMQQHISLLVMLRYLHDVYDTAEWREELMRLAETEEIGYYAPITKS
jgi:hypothetical protein